MGETTGIEWADATWNPWVGCTKVSPGCTHCYAETFVQRKFKRNFKVVSPTKTTFEDPLRWVAGYRRASTGAGAQVSRLKSLDHRPRIFTCSLSDFFHEQADGLRERAWSIIRLTPEFTYLILTKRPERIETHLPLDWGPKGYSNVWLGTSVESQAYVDRLRPLLAVPAPIHFVSAEPLLGPLNLGAYPGFDWVIVGGESGHGARKMPEEWVESLRVQCQNHYDPPVSFFFKQ